MKQVDVPPEKRPLVSVIICSYNYAHFLPRALDSLLGQTLQDIEILVVDDASTDNTEDVVKGYQSRDSRVRYILNARNLKSYDSRIVGMEHALGQYVAFCDADDLHEPDSLEKLYTTAVREQADIVTANVVFNEHNGKVKFAPAGVFDDVLRSVNHPYSGLWSSLFSREIVDKALQVSPRNQFLLHADDWLQKFYLYFYARKRVHIPDQVYHWRLNPGSLSQTLSVQACLDRIAHHGMVLGHIHDFLASQDKLDAYADVYANHVDDLTLSVFNKLVQSAPLEYARLWEQHAPAVMKVALTRWQQERIQQLKHDRKRRSPKTLFKRWLGSGKS